MSKRHAREHGRILSVDEETLGSVLVADAALGATTLYVDDAAEFEDDGTGGWLSINDQQIQYGAVDDDAGTITLRTPLLAAADDGDPVYVWSTLYDTEATVKTALVMVDGEDDNTDPIHATLAEAVQDLPEGLRGEAGESCTLVRVSDDEWEVTAVGGLPTTAKGVKFEADDFYVLTAGDITAGTATFPLSHRPADEGMVAFWRTTPQEPTEYTVDYDAQTVTWPLEGFEKTGDRLWVHYAYRRGIVTGSLVTPTFIEGIGGTTLGAPVVVTLPSSIQAGDQLIAVMGKQAHGGDAGWALPAGWSLLTPDAPTTDGYGVAFSKVATGGDAGAAVTFPTGGADSGIFGGAGVAVGVFRNARVDAVSVMTSAGVGGAPGGVATAASVTASDDALVLGLWVGVSSSSVDIIPADKSDIEADLARGSAAISERQLQAGPSGTATALVGGAGYFAWQVALTKK